MDQIAGIGDVERRFASSDWTARVTAVEDAGDLLAEHFRGDPFERLFAIYRRLAAG